MLSRLELTPAHCIKTVLPPLLDNIPISINGSLTPKDLFTNILGMSTDKLSIHSIGKQYHNTPCETSMRYHLHKIDFDQLIENNAKILLQSSHKTLDSNKKYDLAIDYTNDPYYGEVNYVNENYVIRGQAKKSTNSFYSYISLCIINKYTRFTISMLPVEKGKTKTDYLKYFIDVVDKINLKINILCLDREFYSRDVFTFLQENDIPHITPVVRKGKRIKDILDGNNKRYEKYVMKNKKGDVGLDIAIDVKYLKGKRGKNGCENLGFVVYGIDWEPGKISTIYRKRFTIESSYRMRNVVKPKTSSRDPMLRYFYALISFMLKNAWVSIQRMHFMKVKRGPKTIEEDVFRFDLFVHFVEEWVKKRLKVKLVVKCYR
ncbi:ISH3-like element ISMbu7 family transposase [Methanococcoides burtonii]|uniref:Transposase IS4-like domain-containing protein n=1 Tax=Methanococcoides burtonii (strain DSM 6242 / NBRC 107633 / OCM 468 / ACE-M) TaxID=259564 RepID=Q12YN3_METBU|nr:ISH3-like element ISMbu7 family transposase [Methanococcoides burtonii]ABE51443.1 Hypothetical protein Mbur_0458 [Methanococcoides burtonii DSM 6242]